MLFELTFWHMRRLLWRPRFVLVMLVMILLQTWLSFSFQGFLRAFSDAHSVFILELALLFASQHPVYDCFTVQFLLRVRSRWILWSSHILAHLLFSFLSVLILLVISAGILLLVKYPLFSTNELRVMGLLHEGFWRVAVMIYLLLVTGIATGVVLIDVLQLFFKRIVVASLVSLLVVVISFVPYLALDFHLAHQIFWVSPLLRACFVINLVFHASLFLSLMVIMIWLLLLFLVGLFLFSRKGIYV
nr:hypothetical protein [Bacilli bacterium]